MPGTADCSLERGSGGDIVNKLNTEQSVRGGLAGGLYVALISNFLLVTTLFTQPPLLGTFLRLSENTTYFFRKLVRE